MYLHIYKKDDYDASQDNHVPNHDNINLSDDAVICVPSYL